VRRAPVAALALAALLAGCGSPPPDLFVVTRSGGDRNANVRLRVSDGGTVTCNGKEHELPAEELLTARQLARDLAPEAELGLELPSGRGGCNPKRAYTSGSGSKVYVLSAKDRGPITIPSTPPASQASKSRS